MDLTLKNTDFEAEGIFGILTCKSDDKDVFIAYTLQHAYDSGLGNGTFVPKVPVGTYSCVRGIHRLANMVNNFITFEIIGVPGHTNILFHQGNTNSDSEGCVLLGSTLGELNKTRAILGSHEAFTKFMNLQTNINSFKLTVI